MKKLTIMTLVSLLLSCCATIKKTTGELTFELKSNIKNDKTALSLLITNHTATNYYLPIFDFNGNEKIEFAIPGNDDYHFFCMLKNFKTGLGNEKEFHSDTCFADDFIDEDMIKLREKWMLIKKEIALKDLVLIKSGKQLEIKVPFYTKIKITDNCIWELQNFKYQQGLFLSLNYPEKSLKSVTTVLEPNILKELELKGYKLYTKEIISNKIQVAF